MTSMVFIYPQHLEFPENFETQTISIFNPHDFTIHFHFECTRPNAFLLSATEGDILAKHSLEITVNLLDKSISEEKFQVRLSLPGKGKRLGEKIIKVTLKSDRGNEDDGSSTSSSRHRKASKTEHLHFQELSPAGFDKSSAVNYGKLKLEKVPNEYFVYGALVIAMIILMLPLDVNYNLPQPPIYAVSVNIKLVAAYILGIVTVFLIRN